MVTSQLFYSGLEQLPVIRSFLRDAWKRGLQAVGDDVDRSDAMYDLELALQEAASNVMIHAYGRKPGGPIRLTVEHTGESVIVHLQHRGRGFDRSQVPDPVFDGSQFGGYGVYLIERLVDECDYLEDGAGWKTIRLVKHLEPLVALGAP